MYSPPFVLAFAFAYSPPFVLALPPEFEFECAPAPALVLVPVPGREFASARRDYMYYQLPPHACYYN